MISINGVRMPSPTKYKVSFSDLDSPDTSRTESGLLVRDRVRQGVVKIEVSWTVGSKDVSKLMRAVTPDKFTVQFFNPETGSYDTIQAYVGDRSNNMKSCTTNNPAADALWEVSFNLIEY